MRRDPNTLVGIDVAYFSAEVLERQTDETTLIEGPPTLAIEVLSPSDRTEDIRDKVSGDVTLPDFEIAVASLF